MLSTILGILAITALIALSALFVATEFALVAVDRARLETAATEGSRAARTTLAMHRRLSFQLSGAQLGITLCSLALGLMAGPALAGLLEPLLHWLPGDPGGTSVVASLVVATLGQMVLGELVPKSVAVARPLRTAVRYAPVVAVFTRVASPLITLSNGVANRVVRILGVEPAEEVHGIRSRADLGRVIQSSAEQGTIAPQGAGLLRRTFDFAEKTAADALTPRVSVQALPEDATVAELVQQAALTGLSRFPVYRLGLDDIIGIVLVKDVFGVPHASRPTTRLTELLRPVPAIPESKPLDELLVELRGVGDYLAVVLDEYGGTAGIVTLEDVVEEIVGDIADEHDPREARPVLAWGGAFLLSGLLHLDEVEASCGMVLPSGEYDTLAGFVLDRLGRIPVVGDSFEHEGWRLEVREMDGRRVATLRAMRTLTPEGPHAADSPSADRR